jgi:hypothetical protein
MEHVMKQFIGILALLMLSVCTFAQTSKDTKIVLDKIRFEVSSKQWVTTQKAMLSVTLNATLTNADLVKARADILTRLNKIVKGDWHLTAFDRTQDSSGLEKLHVQAQVRVLQSDLTNIYQQAKSVSLPGAQYEISGIEFKPDLDEIQEVKAKIREQLYQKINDEMTRINKLYPKQKYSLNHVDFVEGVNIVQPRQQAKMLNAMAMAPSAAPLAVSNELVLTAIVEVASNRTEEN